MTVARNFSAVVKIIENAELKRQLVLVGRDVGAVERKGWVAVANLSFADIKITENLVIGSILFDHVDHMLDGILSAGELDLPGIVVQQGIVLDYAGEFFEFAKSRGNIQTRD